MSAALPSIELSSESKPQYEGDIEHKDDLEEGPPALQDRTISAYAEWPAKKTVATFWRLYLIGFAVSVSGMYLGFTLSLPGSIVANRGFIAQFGTVMVDGQLALDAQYVGLWNAINFVSQVVFQVISPFSADRFGLRFNLYTFTLFILLAIIIEIVAKTWWQFLFAKIVGGFAAGFIGTSIMAYISEITMPKMRGPHLSAFAFFFALGQVASAIALEVLEQTAPFEFRRAFYAEFAILGVWLPILILLPESPAWYYKKGKHDAAKKSLRRLIGNVPGYDWDREYAVMAEEIDNSLVLMEKSSKYGFVACFKGTSLRRTLVSTVPFSMQNFVGAPLMFNVTYFFSLIGLKNAFQSNVIVLCVLMAGVVASFYLVDKVGRRPLLLGGGVVMSICVLIVGIIGTKEISGALPNVLVAVVCIWVIAYSLSCAPIGWLCLVELSTPMLRTQTAGIAAVLQSCSGVVFNYTVPLMISPQYAGWGAKIGFFFAGLAILFTILVWFTVPETKGLTYGEIDDRFERRLPAWRFTKRAVEPEQASVIGAA